MVLVKHVWSAGLNLSVDYFLPEDSSFDNGSSFIGLFISSVKSIELFSPNIL